MAATNRTYYQSVDLSESTTNETAYQTKLSLVFTPEANSKYLILFFWQQGQTATGLGSNRKSRAYRSTSGSETELSYSRSRYKDTNNYVTDGCFHVEEYGASPAEETYEIQYSTADAGYYSKIKNARIVAIKLEDNDVYDIDLTYSANASNVDWVDKASVVFTPPSEGDYIIFANGSVNHARNGYGIDVAIDVDTVSKVDATMSVLMISDYETFASVFRETLDASEHIITWKFKNGSSRYEARAIYTKIIALRVDDFKDIVFGESDSESSTSSTSYIDKLSITDTPLLGKYIQIASAISKGSSSVYRDYIEYTTALQGQLTEDIRETSLGQHSCFLAGYYGEIAALEDTFKIRHKVSSASQTNSVKEARIVALCLEEILHANISAKASIFNTQIQTITAKGNVGTIFETKTQTITVKAKIVCVTQTELVTPSSLSIETTPVYFVWEIPVCCKERNIHAHVQIDKTDDTFGDLEKDLFSYRDSDFEYWDGGAWQTYPTTGVTSAYYGNQARVQVSLTNGNKWWRVRGGVK